jgi:hypothetical protein
MADAFGRDRAISRKPWAAALVLPKAEAGADENDAEKRQGAF